MRLDSREPIGDKEGYELGWPETRMYCVVMRKSIRVDDRDPDVLIGDK